MITFVNGKMLEDTSHYHAKTRDVVTILKQVGEQYQEKENEVRELRQKLSNFKAAAYKDSQMAAMKNELKKMSEDYYRGFPVTEEEKDKIKSWIVNHENEKHGGYPMYHGVSGGGYAYEFYPTGIGIGGSIYCSSCRRKAIEAAAGDYKKYRGLLKEYDASFEFSEVG